MLSQQAKYVPRALLVLAEHADAPAPLPISEIANRERISRKFLQAILVDLRDSVAKGGDSGFSLLPPRWR